jgi:hypothetical protein
LRIRIVGDLLVAKMGRTAWATMTPAPMRASLT